MKEDDCSEKTGFLQSWRELLTALEEVGTFIAADSRAQTGLLRAEAPRYMLRVLDNMRITGIELENADFPRLIRLFDTYRQFGNANPDCVYFYARISPEHRYRIYGQRGTSKLVEVQTMNGHFLAGPNHAGLITLSNIEPDAEGNIDVVLSSDPQHGDWVELKSDARWVYVRQYFYDWETERAGDLIIERVGATYPPPPSPARELESRVEQVIAWIPTWYRHLSRMAASYYESPANSFNFVNSKSGMSGLYYGKGHFSFDDGECIVLEFKPPAGPYWSFQIMNHFWESLEWDVRQTSLNGHQGSLDPDGVFRAIISDVDPEVANWLDTCGHQKGLICGRVLKPETLPLASLRTVKLADLAKELPGQTPRITPDERSEALRRRALSVARRYRE